MLWQIVNGFDVEGGKASIFFRAPFLELSALCGAAAAVPSIESDNPADRYAIT